MGRVSPPKVQPGQSVTSGAINDGIASIRGQASNIDALNVRDEALEARQFQDPAFIRDFSWFQARGVSSPLRRYVNDGGAVYGLNQIPVWDSANVTNKNGALGSAMGSTHISPHVIVQNNGNKFDASVIKCSFSIWMNDIAFQTYRRTYKQRWKGPIIKCALGRRGSPSTDGEDYTIEMSTVQWFQLPWSGGLWNSFAESDGPITSYAPSGATGPTLLSSSMLSGWYENEFGAKQIVPHQRWADFGFSPGDSPSPNTFSYNFTYQACFVWKPTGGDQSTTFVPIIKMTFDDTVPCIWGTEITEPIGSTRTSEWEVVDEDESSESYEAEHSGSAVYVRQGNDELFQGVHIRNLTMNAVTYSGGR